MELKVTALAIEDAALLLSRVGALVTAETIRRHIAAGAPTNADGTLSLVYYAAWLNRELTPREVPNGN
jgi:hypothetical protein